MPEENRRGKGKVGFRMGYTENLGDFRSLKFEFSVEDVDVQDDEDYMEALERVYEDVSGRLGEEVEKAQRSKRGKAR